MKAKKSLVILDSSVQFDEFKKFSMENTTFVAADYETHKKLVDSNIKHELLDNYLQKKERLELYDFVLSKYTWYENLSRKSDFEFNSINILSLMSSLEFHEFVLTVLIKLFSIKNIISSKSPNEIFVSEKFLKHVKLVQDKNKIHTFDSNLDNEKSFLTNKIELRFNILSKPCTFYINQIEVAKNIVKSLPIEYRLLVKEHPASGVRSWRKIDVYKELMSTPNVVPIHHSANTEELIKKSSLVISLSSSTSLDALFFKKPSIVFVDTNYSMIPEVRKIDKIENLSNTIHDALKTKIDPKNIEKYVQFIEKNSFDYNFILHVMEMQKYVFHGSLLVDVEFSEKEMNEFFDKTKSEFVKLTNAYIKKINETI